MRQELLDLLSVMARHFALGRRESDDIASEASFVLSQLSPLAEPVQLSPPTHHPSLRHLPTVLARNPALLENRLAPIAAFLPWRYGYSPRPDAPELENEMAWAELVGPAAPIFNETVGFGLTLIGPRTHYLPHRHPAIELYAVVAGTALWTADETSRDQPPGSFILHRSNVIHAMRTRDEALLAIYSWTGDIVSPTTYAGC